MSELVVQDLSKRFQKTAVLQDVCLRTQANEFVSLVGPSGCGKTTLLRIVAGLEAADQGTVSIDGRELSNVAPKDRNCAMVFQGESVYPHMTVQENLSFPLRMRNQTSDEIEVLVSATAEQLGIADMMDRMPATLSGGQRQRVALGRALVRKPKVFLLDEPFSNLDAHLKRQLRDDLLTIRKNSEATWLFVTHDIQEALQLGDRIAVMHDGRIQQFDTSDQLLSSPANDFVQDFVAA